VSLIGHTPLTRWLELRYGGGIGVGWVMGDVLMTNNSDQVCNAQTAADTTRCYPISNGKKISLNPPDEAALKATEGPGTDTAQTPHRHVSQDKPPVMAVVNILVGVRFKLHRHFAAKVEVGFRDMLFFGGGAEYVF
jgi:hypothetical protein